MPTASTRINDLKKRADELLSVVEADGVTLFYESAEGWEHRSVRHICHELRIEGGRTMPGPPEILISYPTTGGSFGAAAVTGALLMEAGKPDNKRKLGTSQVAERHLFMYVHSLNLGPRLPLLTMEPPPEPIPPAGNATHAWAVTETFTPGDFVIWRAPIGAPWRKHVIEIHNLASM